jgi:ribosomal protein L40E
MLRIDAKAALVRYDAMCHAIASAYEVDEVKEIRDKAVALQCYARQAKNAELERKCTEIRLRAERKAGELLRQMEKQGPGQHQRSDRTTVAPKLSELGVTKDQSSQWQKLAAVPEAEFEAALAGSEKPSLKHIVEAATERARADAAEEARRKIEEQLREQTEARKAAEDNLREKEAAAEKARQKKQRAAENRRARENIFDKMRLRRRGRPILASDRERIAKILGMLGSDHDGEALAAARRAETARVRLGVTWYELLGVGAERAAAA